jgi:hypothetical protein
MIVIDIESVTDWIFTVAAFVATVWPILLTVIVAALFLGMIFPDYHR